jgi:hypothetical protein
MMQVALVHGARVLSGNVMYVQNKVYPVTDIVGTRLLGLTDFKGRFRFARVREDLGDMKNPEVSEEEVLSGAIQRSLPGDRQEVSVEQVHKGVRIRRKPGNAAASEVVV